MPGKFKPSVFPRVRPSVSLSPPPFQPPSWAEQRVRSSREIISREGSVTGWRASVHAMNLHTANFERREAAVLDVYGTFDEPVKGVSAFEFMLVPGPLTLGNAEIASVGVILKAKPKLEGVVRLSVLEYQTALFLAASGELRSCTCSFQSPRYGSGLIATFTLGSQPVAEVR